MEFQDIPVSPIDKELRAMEEAMQKAVLSHYAITPTKFMQLMAGQKEKVQAVRCRKGVLSRAWVWLSTRSRCHGKA